MTDLVKVHKSDGVLTLVMNRPEKKNALTDAMYGVLADALLAAQTDASTRAILIRGEGEAFTAGNDLGEFAAMAAGSGLRNVTRFIEALATNVKPLVAAAHGHAVGVGTTMLLHCDYVLLADDIRLSTPFVSLALVPEAASSLLLPARIGHARAFAMLALGETVGAEDALAWGLANRITSREGLTGAAEAIAARLVTLPAGAVAATRRLMRDSETVLARMNAETEEFSRRLTSPEAREAFTAFAERRAPDFSRFS
ncbi:enoyl-CoA hydratase [Acetobacter nitrogenifigens]|uniref:enoyl-CoA hydratase n=1 Tax=Acetobacter nitrogenifigens TaxID=285268 RepID=UPI00047B434A|nr:enoyl-CoA hydratase [Acetobacter nitrogenifigens]